MIQGTTSLLRRDMLRQSATIAAVLGAGCVRANPLAAADRDGATGWQLGCFTRPFSEFTYAQTLDGIASAGYDAVGLMSAKLSSGTVTLANANREQLAEIREEAAKRKLAISATYYGGPPVNQSLTAGIEAMQQLVDHCDQVGCATILLGGTGDPTLFDAYYQAVKAVCNDATEKHVAVVLKPHGGLNATGPECRRIIERVGHPNFRIWYDPGNIFYYSEGELDPLEDVASVDGLVTGMCVKDFAPPRDVAINPGSGRVNFPELMTRLRAGGLVSGPLVVETLAPGDYETTKANARQARIFLESLLKK